VRERTIVPAGAITERRATALLEAALLAPADRPVRAAPGPDVIVQSWSRSFDAFAVTPNGKELVASSERGIIVFDLASGLLRRTLGTGRGSIAVTTDHVYVATSYGVEVRELESGTRVARGTADLFASVGGITANGEIVTAAFREIEVYAAWPFTKLRSVTETTNVARVVVSVDGNTIGVLYDDGKLALRDATTLAVVRTIACGYDAVNPFGFKSKIAISAGAAWVACSTARGSIVVQRGDGTGINTVRPDLYYFNQNIYDLQFHPTKPLLAVGSLTGTSVVDVTKPGGGSTRYEGPRERTDVVAWLSDGTLASGALGGDLTIHDQATKARLRVMEAGSAGTIDEIARAGTGVLAFGESKHLRTWHADTGHEHPFDESASRYHFAWSVDGKAYVVAANRDLKRGIVVTTNNVSTWIEIENVNGLAIANGGKRVHVLRTAYQKPPEIVTVDVATKTIVARAELPPSMFPRLVSSQFTGELAVITESEQQVTKVSVITPQGSLSGSYELPRFFQHVTQIAPGRWLATTTPNVSLWDGKSTKLVPTTLSGKHVAVSLDGKHLALTDDRALRIVDATTLAELVIATNLPESKQSLWLAPELIATLQEDGTVALRTFHGSKLAEAGRLVAAPSRGTILIAPDGSYMAEPAAARAIGFTVGRDAYRFEQFDRALNKPHVALAMLGVASQQMLAIYEAAYRRRIARGGAPPVVRDMLRAPRIDLGKPLPAHVSDATISVELRATAPGHTLARIDIRVNGIPMLGRTGKDVRGRKASELVLVESVPLEIGTNRIELAAENDQGVTALGRAVVVVRDGTPVPGAVYAIAIGVSTYKEAGHDLRFASKDADDFAKAFAKVTDKATRVESIVLRDGQVTRTALLDLGKRLATTKPEDTVVMFVSGHGLLDPTDNQYVFGTHDVEFDAPKAAGFRFDELEGLLTRIPARRRLLLLDTCHAGELDPDELAFVERAQREGRKGVRRVSATPAAMPKGGIDPRARAMAARALFTELRGSGITVLASSAGAEYSYEDAGVENGLFTHALVDGLAGKADRDKDGAVRVTELLDYLATTVSERSAGFQVPQARQLNRELDFDLTTGVPHTRPLEGSGECVRLGDAYQCSALTAIFVMATRDPAGEFAAVLAQMKLPATTHIADDKLPKVPYAKRIVLPNANKGYPDLLYGWLGHDPATKRTALCYVVDGIPPAIERCKRAMPLLLQKDPPLTLPE